MKVAVVTGCSSEIGHAVCHALRAQRDQNGREAYRIFAADRRAEELAYLEHQGFETICMDISSNRSVARAVRHILELAGRIDIAVCDAGVVTAGPIIDQEVDSALRALDINVVGFLRLVKAITPVMMEQKQGLIVVMGSMSAYLSVPFGGIYSGTKACLHNITEALRMEIAPWSIDVMLVEHGKITSTLAANSVHQLPPIQKHCPAYEQAFSGKDLDQVVYISNAKNDGDIGNAAEKMVQAMQKANPPHKLQVGGGCNRLRLMGFTQVWICPRFISRMLSKAFGLNRIFRNLRQPSVNKKHRKCSTCVGE